MRRLALALLVACGGHKPVDSATATPFVCRDRLASYVATGHLSGDEIGVEIDCAQVGPRIKRWRSDKAGTRQDDAHSLTAQQFDDLWNEIDTTGWQSLKNCTNGSTDKSGARPTRSSAKGGAEVDDKHDPIWVFDVKDDQNKASFECQARVAPAPYNGIVDPLDLAANRGTHQLGDDDPAAAKAKVSDKKAKQ